MASSSTSSIQKGFKYDVFLSFRGDTRKAFVDHLYNALDKQGIYTYKDNERITKGERIDHELMKAIEDSRYYIIVLSKNYASSSWCLDELVKIMECQKTSEHTAFPIFYDVNPTEVRWQTGEVGKAFAQLKNEKDAEKWIEALKAAADLAGSEERMVDNGAKFIKDIVGEISERLYNISFSFDEKLVGIETKVEEIVAHLELDINDVRMIGIKGMGGLGKTTLARAVFDKISFRFEGKSFVNNVREVSSSLSGLESLQKNILSSVLNDKRINQSVVDMKNMMERRMRGIKALIVLDDVDKIEQLQALAGERNWFMPGSRIIITTRDEKVLQAYGVEWREVELLSDNEARCLFSKRAFKTEVPDEEYKELSERVVRYANGLPLTLETLGSSLCGEDKLVWKETIEELKIIPLHNTMKRLELSYTRLEGDYKEIFLDVACMMKGWRKDAAVQALESCGFCAERGLRTLQQKSLITINVGEGGYKYVDMHDSIQEMGKDIVRRVHPTMPEKHSRLWEDEEIEHILGNDLCTEETICLKIHTQKVSLESVIKGLRKMKKLRFLDVDIYLENPGISKVNPYFPDALRYFYWHNYPFKCLPQTFQANNLVSLRMPNSKIVQLWEGGEKKVLKKLKFLDLSSLLEKLPDVRQFQSIRDLNLSYSNIRNLPDNIFMLEHLNDLNLSHCLLLEELPDGLGLLRCLRSLNLSYLKIRNLPDSICLLEHLNSLNLSHCSLLEKLPKDLGLLRCLRALNLSYSKIRNLPDSICMLEHLNSLKLDECLLLENLPEDLGRLTCLCDLNVSYSKIRNLPDSICMLEQLNSLNLSHCSLLEKLPEDLGRLRCLRALYLSYSKIRNLPDSICMVQHLNSLNLGHCSKIRSLPDSICMLEQLNSLNLGHCSLLEKLPEAIGRLRNLRALKLSYSKIRNLPDSICMVKHLNSLKLEECTLLETLPQGLGQLRCLCDLNLSYSKIRSLPDSICMLEQLNSLNLGHCSLLEMLPEAIGRLRCLRALNISYSNIRNLPDSICMVEYLNSLNLSHCSLLEKLPEGLGGLRCLGDLNLSYSKIRNLPESICMLEQLNSLNLGHCLFLEKLPEGLGRLRSLRALNLSYSKIRILPDSICMVEYLNSLDLSYCLLLEKLPKGLGGLQCLCDLNLSYSNITNLPDSICMLEHLYSLNLSHCSLLEKLPEDIGRLRCLGVLNLSYSKIRNLPDSICMLEHMHSLGLDGCND